MPMWETEKQRAAILPMVGATNYARGTWLDREELAYPSGALRNSRRRARVMCSDGVLRIARLGIADTFFSIPAYVRVRGRYCAGYVTIETARGMTTETEEDSALVKFCETVSYRAGAWNQARIEESSRKLPAGLWREGAEQI